MKLDKRNQMIDRLVDDMATWDYDSLLQFAQDAELQTLSDLTPEQLEFEYNARFGDEP